LAAAPDLEEAVEEGFCFPIQLILGKHSAICDPIGRQPIADRKQAAQDDEGERRLDLLYGVWVISQALEMEPAAGFKRG
jgi:hypothetical protein